jgi:hypothetical protein
MLANILKTVMQNHVERLVAIIVLGLVAVSSNFTYAQELHQQTLSEIAKNTPSKQNAYITVGKGPVAIDVSNSSGKIYVANSPSYTKNHRRL